MIVHLLRQIRLLYFLPRVFYKSDYKLSLVHNASALTINPLFHRMRIVARNPYFEEAQYEIILSSKRREIFYLFEQDAQVAVKIAQSLKEMLYDWRDVDVKVHRINELEHEGDTVTHEIIAQLHKTFVTPFDREDIALLAHSLDDITDFIEATADAMILYKIDKPTVRAKELADIIVQAVDRSRRRDWLRSIAVLI